MRLNLIAVFSLLMLFPATSWGQTGKFAEKPKVAVIDFAVKGDVGIKDAGEAVSELLLAKLPEERFHLIERSQLAAILTKIRLTIALVRDHPEKVYGRLKGVQYLVVGSVTKLGNLTIRARLVDVATGDIVLRAEVSAEDAGGLKDAIGKLASGLLPMTAEDFARLIETAKAILKDMPSSKDKLTDDQKAKLLEAKRAVDAALTYKDKDDEALALMEQIETYIGPDKETLDLGNKVKMKLVLIPAGKFMMGSPKNEKGRNEDEGPQHEVALTQPYYMGIYHVTRGQFAAFVDDNGYKTDAEKEGGSDAWDGTKFDKVKGASWKKPGFDQTDEHPVVCVSHNDAVAFCEWLSKKTGKTVKLPTEAQWEYAARGGTTTAYQWGNDPDDGKDWCHAADRTTKRTFSDRYKYLSWDDGCTLTFLVGNFKKNGFGLYDMHGNAWQWCSDWYGENYYADSPKTDPQGPNDGKFRVLRGGGWNFHPVNFRSALRCGGGPGNRRFIIGFRVIVEAR